MTTRGNGRAVLFDLDGVVIDTEPVRVRAHASVIERLGGTIEPGSTARLTGLSLERTSLAILAAAGVACELGPYLADFRDAYRAQLEQHIPLCAGVPELLAGLRTRGYCLGLVSSSDRDVMDLVLAHEALRNRFHLSVSVDDVVAAKPDAAPYALAQQLACPWARTAVVFEDSDPGATAAVAAGLPVIGVASGQHAAAFEARGIPSVPALPGIERLTALVDLHQAAAPHATARLGERRLLVIDVPGAERAAAGELAELARRGIGLVEDARRLHGCAGHETVVIAGSLPAGASQNGALAIQVGGDPPSEPAIHGPGSGHLGLLGWLRVWLAELDATRR